MFSNRFLKRIIFVVGLSLIAPTYAAKVDADSLRALLLSPEIKQQIRGAKWSAGYHSDDAQNMAIINDSLNGLLNRKEQLNKYEIKLALLLTQALGYSNDPQHLATLARAKTSGLNGLDKVGAKAQASVSARSATNPELGVLIDKYKKFGDSTKVFIALLFSSVEYTREEGQNYLYTALVYPSDKFDVQQFMALPAPDVAKISAQLDSPVPRERILAATQIYYLGIRSEEIHKKITKQLTGLSADNIAIVDTDETAWLVKALAASGNEKDKPLIERFVQRSTGGLHFHAEMSLGLVDKFASWYSKIEATDFTKASETQLHILLLQAPYLSIKDAAIHHLIQSHNETAEVAEICYNELKFFWPFVRHNAREVRPAARMMQVMARAGNPKYADLLREIMENAPSKHLRAHAKENLGEFK